MNKIAARINQWRLNRWLKQRNAGADNAVALRKSYLKPAKAMSILEYTLNRQLGSVGVLTFSGGKFSSGMDGSLALVMKSMVDLLPTLTQTEQDRIRSRIEKLREHNWGYVRNAAAAAISFATVGA